MTMKILAIETSCDETAVAILEAEGGMKHPTFAVLGNTLLSQALKHAEFGGVYPNLAKREHSKNLVPVLKETLKEASLLQPLSSTSSLHSNVLQNVRMMLEREPELLEQFLAFIPTIEKPDIDAIAVTQGPGLEPALWVGLNFAKALSLTWNIPLVPVNHMEGHIMSVLLGDTTSSSLAFPAVALLISGGHTELVLVTRWLEYELLGQTRDDAVGEAFDKVARILGLPYPGGPEISRLAEESQAESIAVPNEFVFPRPMIDAPNYDFSFSGLKTAVLYKVRELNTLDETTKKIVAQSFEDAVVDVLIHKTKRALDAYAPKALIIGGGVIASKRIREAFRELLQDYPTTTLNIPEMALTTDNAVMIGIAGYFRALHNKTAPQNLEELRARGNLKLTQN